MIKFFLLTLILVNFQAQAQDSAPDTPIANSDQSAEIPEDDSWLADEKGSSNTTLRPQSEKVSDKRKLHLVEKSKSSSLRQIGPRFMLWQEKIKASESGSPLTYNARFSAVAAAYSYKSALGKSQRWLHAHEADFIIGSVKASGTVASATDNLDSLIFFGLQLSPGVAYRTASATLITFSTPLFYRKLSWDLGRPNLQLEGESVFEVGLGVHGGWRFGANNFITTGVTARMHSVLWTIGLDFKL